MIDEARLLGRFCRYVRVDTASDRRSSQIPTTETQRGFARSLAAELEALGARSVTVDEHSFVVARFDGRDTNLDVPEFAPGRARPPG